MSMLGLSSHNFAKHVAIHLSFLFGFTNRGSMTPSSSIFSGVMVLLANLQIIK